MPATTPGMTTGEPPQRQPGSEQNSFGADSMQSILGAGRRETAARHWPEKEILGRREHPLVHPNSGNQNVLTCIHLGAFLFQQSRFAKSCQKILLDAIKPFPFNRMSRHEDQVHWL